MMPSLSKVVCLCAAPTPVAFSAGSIAAVPPPLKEKEEEWKRGAERSCRPCRRCFSESASPSVSLPRSLAPQSEGRCSAASFGSVFALLLPRIVLPSKKRDTDTKWKRVRRQKQDGGDRVDRRLGNGLLRVDVIDVGGNRPSRLGNWKHVTKGEEDVAAGMESKGRLKWQKTIQATGMWRNQSTNRCA